MREADAYILGTDDDELRRLAFQHRVWLAQAYRLWTQAGVRAGQTVVDLGCGPGFCSFELAQLVGPGGRVVARDKSERFLDAVAAGARTRGLEQIETSAGDVAALELADDSVDAIYARWLFCWLRNPAAALAECARVLRPGGVLMIQDYVDWAGMRLLPPCEAFDRAVAGCMRSWRAGGGTIDIGAELPRLAPRAGLSVRALEPRWRIGAVGSLEWRWIGEFFAVYLPKVVAQGHLEGAELAAFQAAWNQRDAAALGFACTPGMIDALLEVG